MRQRRAAMPQEVPDLVGPKCLKLNLHGHFDPSGPRNCSLVYRNPEEGGTTPPPLALSYSKRLQVVRSCSRGEEVNFLPFPLSSQPTVREKAGMV